MWWLILAGYVVPMIGGVVWSGRTYSLDVAEIGEMPKEKGWPQGAEAREIRSAREATSILVLCAILWPLVFVAVVLYYVIASPFLIGNHLGRRVAEQKAALRKKYTEQADYLRLLAKDEDDVTMQEILRGGADALAQQAKEL